MVKRSGRSGRSKSIGSPRTVSAGVATLILMPLMLTPAWSRPDLLATLADYRAAPVVPAITVQAAQSQPNFHVQDISGPAGQPIPISIKTTDKIPGDSRQLFIFSGLPKGVTLNPGGDLGDFWAVNASVIGSLSLTAPDGFSGAFTVRITRPGGQPNGGVATMKVTIGEVDTTATAAVSQTTPKNERNALPPATGAQLSNQDMLMARARALFQKADVAGARIIFEYLANQGNSGAATAMGETFDPAILSQLVVKGLESDIAKARHWYEKAERLGSGDARRRLNAMIAR